ncbi:hypothetical protein ZOSMA_575G00010 [Zostera marina]|uniref:Uncharacterized protein n=1 Tax=Zostera marina TaxID=29655 RepID=A0A0K9NVT9_ZOSMR|nr:hypothetical protein ZOSMA_575G00010 [Zostera marina]
MPSENRKRKSKETQSEGLKKKEDKTSFDSISVGSSMCKDKAHTSNAASLGVKAKRERTEDNLHISFLEEYNWATYIRDVLFLKMETCRNSVLHRRVTNCGSKEYLDGSILVLMVWLYKHTMIAKPDDVYVDFDPYFKKWDDEVILLRPTLADLRPCEVFKNDIPLNKRMSLMNEMDAESSKEENDNSDAGHDNSESGEKTDSSDSNKKRKKMITQGKKPVVEEKNQKKKKNTTNENNAAKLLRDAINSIDKERPRVLVKKKSSKKKKDLQSPVRRSSRLSSGKSDSTSTLKTADKYVEKFRIARKSKKVQFNTEKSVENEDLKNIAEKKTSDDGKEEKDDANEEADGIKSSDDVQNAASPNGIQNADYVHNADDVNNEDNVHNEDGGNDEDATNDSVKNNEVDAEESPEEGRENLKDASKIVLDDAERQCVDDDTKTMNVTTVTVDAAIVEVNEAKQYVNDNVEQVNDTIIYNNVRQVEVTVEDEHKTDDAKADEKVVQAVEIVNSGSRSLDADKSNEVIKDVNFVTAGIDDDSEVKANDDNNGLNAVMNENFNPPSISLGLFGSQTPSEGVPINFEVLKVPSKPLKIISEPINVHPEDAKVSTEAVKDKSEEVVVFCEGGHLTYEANVETRSMPTYVGKGKGCTDYPTLIKVKEELYEAWKLKIKDNVQKLGDPKASSSKKVDFTVEDNPSTTGANKSISQTYGKGKKMKIMTKKGLRK